MKLRPGTGEAIPRVRSVAKRRERLALASTRTMRAGLVRTTAAVICLGSFTLGLAGCAKEDPPAQSGSTTTAIATSPPAASAPGTPTSSSTPTPTPTPAEPVTVATAPFEANGYSGEVTVDVWPSYRGNEQATKHPGNQSIDIPAAPNSAVVLPLKMTVRNTTADSSFSTKTTYSVIGDLPTTTDQSGRTPDGIFVESADGWIQPDYNSYQSYVLRTWGETNGGWSNTVLMYARIPNYYTPAAPNGDPSVLMQSSTQPIRIRIQVLYPEVSAMCNQKFAVIQQGGGVTLKADDTDETKLP